MTTDMEIYTNETEYIQYYNGVPQGSTLSPVMFNIYFQKAIASISPYTDLLLAYADDTVIIIETLNNLHKAIIELKKWKNTFNLEINTKKTEVFIRHYEKPIYINYPVTSEYTYLGSQVDSNAKLQTKKGIRVSIKEFAKKSKMLVVFRNQLKANKFIIL